MLWQEGQAITVLCLSVRGPVVSGMGQPVPMGVFRVLPIADPSVLNCNTPFSKIVLDKNLEHSPVSPPYPESMMMVMMMMTVPRLTINST